MSGRKLRLKFCHSIFFTSGFSELICHKSWPNAQIFARLSQMDLNELQSHFQQECTRFATLCEDILDHAVPSCPGWTVQDLIEHLGTVHRRAIARIGSQTDPTGIELNIPTETTEMLNWFDAGWRELDRAFTETPPSAQAWNWTGQNQTVGWMIRRQAHEAAIHRYDAELAHMGLPSVAAFKSLPTESIPFGYVPEFAKDGLNERLYVSIAGRSNLKGSLPGSLHFHANDTEAESTITFIDGVFTIEEGHSKADAAIRGTASELYLWSWGRLPADVLQCFGEMSVIESWAKLPA